MLKSKELIFETLTEALLEGVVVVDKSQKIVSTNTSAAIMFGYTKKDLEGKPLKTLIPTNFHKNHDKHFKRFFGTGEKRQMGSGRDLYGAKKNGDQFPVEVGLNPFVISNEHYVLALVIDITARKEVEKERVHWNKIFNESLNEIYVFDGSTLKFVNVNLGAQRNIGYSLNELKKMTPVDLKPEYNEGEFRKLLKPLIENKVEKVEFETIHERKDKSTYPVDVHLQLSSLENEEIIVAIILDITERKNYTVKLEKTVEERTIQLQEALAAERELNELKTQFLSLVSHEFKTPLSGILTSSTLLSKYTKTEQQDKRTKHIDTIKSKVHYLNNILNDFLSIERLDSNKVNYKPTQFNLSKVFNEVVYNANMLLKDGQRINYPDNIDEFDLYQDEKILQLILSNLLHNAIKYSGENSIIDIEVDNCSKTNKVCFNITDEGIGIPKEDQKHIFGRYFRAKNVLTHQGTGIGLNIVKSHIENLGGIITFESKENKGSTFKVELPIKVQNEENITY